MTAQDPTSPPSPHQQAVNELHRDGWRQGNDGLWRNDRFGGAYKIGNAVQRVGSEKGEVTRPAPEERLIPAAAAERLAEALEFYRDVRWAREPGEPYSPAEAAGAEIARSALSEYHSQKGSPDG